MAFGTITATESTFGSISGSIVGAVPGTLSGSVGVPGPQGPAGSPGAVGPQGPQGIPGVAGQGVPVGGTSGQFLQKTSGADYATDWTTVNLAAYAVKSNNLSDLTNFATARDNLSLGSSSTPTFAGVNVPGSGTNVANLGSTSLTINQSGHGQFTIQPSQGIVFPNGTIQTTAFTGVPADYITSVSSPLTVTAGNLSINLSAYAPIAGPVFTGDPRGPTAALGDNDTSLATTAFVQQELLSGTANARNLEVYVRNQTGSTIPAGSIVYINGATGNRPTITLAQANNDANSAQTFGFTKAAIANNGFGYVIVRGELENINTSALTEGVQLYLSPTTAGTWTTTKPSAPQHLVYVGICVRAHPTQGVILVAVQNGYELPELHDVSITSVANNDLLTYESSSTLWKNKSISTLGLATQSYVTSGFAPIDAGLPVSGTVGQVLTKNSGTNYDASWATLVPGDRYLTSSTTSNTIGTGTKTFTVGTGLSYSPQQDVVISFDASNHMHALVTTYNSGTGVLVVNVQSVTGSGTYAAWTVNVGGTTPLQSVEWGEILGTLGDQTDLATALNAKLETSTAASTYAALAGATFTGEVILPASNTSNAGLTITPGVAPTSPVNGEIWATTNDLQVRLNGVTETLAEQSWVTANFYPLSGNPSGFLTSASLSGYALLSGATFTGLVGTVASTTTTAGLNLPHGTAPTTPVNGDLWSTTGGLFWRQNGSTKQAMNLGDTQTVSGNITFSNGTLTLGSSTGASTYNIGTGATLTATTKAINIGTNGVSGSTTTITIGSGNGTTTTFNGTLNAGGNVSLGTFNGTTTVAIANGATTTGLTKTVSVGTGGLAGSTTNIAIGSTTGTSTTTLQGTTNGVTAAADTNSVALATTAYVVGQAGSATPLVDGTAAVGTSLRYARQDHVHPTDTTRAPLASPTFTGTVTIPAGASISGFAPLASPSLTGTPTSTTAAVDTNTTQIATTAFVVAQASAATPLVDGTAAVGTSLRYARADHVHPTDTSRAALNSPAFTGTPSLPTGTTAVTQTAGNNTTAVATTAFVTAAVPAFGVQADVNEPLSTTKAASIDNVRELLMSPGHQILYQGAGVNGTLGAGAATNANSGRWKEYVSPNAGVAGYALGVYDTTAASIGAAGYTRGVNLTTRNYSKKIWLTGRCMVGHFSLTSYDGSANTFARISFGGFNAMQSGDMVAGTKGIGWRLQGGGSQAMVLQVANGTTVTNVTSSFTPVTKQVFDWEIYSDGAGNVTLFVNDSQVATTTAGPTGTGGGLYMEGVDSTASSTAPFILNNLGTKIFYGI